MPMGYQTELSDGASIRVDKKQRIALARALNKVTNFILMRQRRGLDVLNREKGH